MNLHTLRVFSGMCMLLGGLMLLAGFSRWGRHSAQTWAGDAAGFAGVAFIAVVVVRYCARSLSGLPYVRVTYCNMLLCGVAVGLLLAVTMSGELKKMIRKRSDPPKPPDGTR